MGSTIMTFSRTPTVSNRHRSVVALLLTSMVSFALLLPVAAGGPVHPQKVIRLVAPYHGTWYPYRQVTATGCASAKFTHLPTFSLGKGAVTYGATATGRSCRGTSTMLSDVYTQVHAQVPIPYDPGSPTLYANFSWAWSANLTLSAGNCRLVGTPSYASCNRESQVNLVGYVYYMDLTAGKQWGSWTLNIGSNTTLNYTSCSSSSCGSSTSGKSGPVGGSGKFSVYLPSTAMNKGDRYVVQFILIGDVSTYFNTANMDLSGASGSSTLDLDSHGNGLILNSIVLT